MSWSNKSATLPTRSMRSASLSTTERIMALGHKSAISSRTFTSNRTSTVESPAASTDSSTVSIESSASETSSDAPQPVGVQRLYLLLPNHKCPNKKECPFHPPEEEEEELEEAEVTFVNKRRAMSLASHEGRMISEQLLAEKLAKINQQISSHLLEGNKLHLPRKTSHDITLPTADLDRLRYDHSNTPATSSTREHSVTSDYDLDSGVTFDSCSDRELDEETLPLIQEEIVVPDLVLPVELKLQTEVQEQTTTTEVVTTVEVNETSTVESVTFTSQTSSSQQQVENSAAITIEEQVPEVHTKPSFNKELEYLTATEGSLVRLECCVAGDPRPNIKWLKNNEVIDPDNGYKIQRSEDGTVTLIIEGAEVEDSGSYTCVADNVAGSATTQSKIRVQKATEVVPEPAAPEVKQQQPLVPPQFTTKLKNRTTEEGATVHLKCSVTGFPEPTYRWFKDGKEISDGLGVKLRNNDGILSLEIARVKQSLAGEYTVEASNSEGIISSSCILQVEGDKEIEPLELDIVRPKFIRKIQDLHVKQGEDAIFTCTATGKPMPEFKWHRDMINITASDQVVIEFNNQGRAQMTLKKVKPSDYGLYNCVAQSRAGRAKCSAYLHVTERTTSPDKEVEFAIIQARKESSVERAYNLGSPPSLVLMLPDTLDIVVGGKLKLDSSVQGYPMPLVTWHKGDRGLMYSQRHRIVPCGSLHTMEIPQVMALDKGEYIVRATNIYGTVQSSCYVNILPKGSNISAPDYTRKTLVVEAKENLIAPYFVKHLPKTIDALLGMNIRLDCILREGIELIKRSQSESTFQDLEKDKKELVDEGFHGEFIPLEAKSKDKSRSHAEDKKQSEVVINKPSKQEDTVSKAINFTTTLKDLVQPAGSEVIFECSTSGATEPEVKWYKDGKELVSNNRIIVVAAGSKHTLRIADVRSTDEGVYTCKLPQVADDKSCSAALTVTEEVRERTPPSKTPPVEQEQKPTSDKTSPQPVLVEKIEKPEIYEPPSFNEKLPKTTAAKHGDNVELTCQLASPDVASVEWELDGTQLQGEARKLASSEESNSRHKLTIQSVTGQDSGKYTCLVYLKNGDFVQTTTQLIVTAAKPTPVQKKEEVEKIEKPEVYVPPSFGETLPKTTAAKHGDNVELTCQLASPDVASVKWELDGTQLQEEARYLASSDESNSRHKLTIQSVTGQDSGKYTCVVNLKNGDLVHTSTQLMVTAAKPTPVQKSEDVKPHFTTKLTDTVVKDGEGLTLECDIEGNPRPQILWLRDDVEVFDSSDFQISTIGCHCKLQVTEIYPEDEGNYTCRAVNALGEASSTCYVSVEDTGGYLSADSAASSTSSKSYAQGDKKKSKKEQEVSEVAPELVVKPRRQFIDDGGKAKFKSSFDGSQNTKLFWSKNGQVLKESENILMYEADGFHFLEVKKVSAEDVGMYSVTVQNSAGSDTAEAELEVFEKPKLLTRSGPEWEQSLHNLTVEEDDTNVKLVCTCKELTQPSVRWFHNGKEVFSGFHMKLQHEAQTATLTIKSIQEKDAGEFKCVMTGKNGELETSCILSIGSPEIMEPPVFEKELHDMEVDEGDKLELDVEVKGAALARITWYHNNIEIMHDNPQYLIASSGNVHTLTVPHATSESSGEYVCEAYNDIGSTDTYCFIEVRDVKRPEPPSFVVHPTSLSAHEGQTAATFTCQVKGQPMPNVLWKKSGIAIATDQKFKITRILDCHTLTVYNLGYMDQGEYVCYLYNTQGEVSYTFSLHVTTDQDYSSQPQNVDFKNKSRMSQLENAQQMSQPEKADASRDHQQFSPEYFNEKRRSHWEDDSKYVEAFTSKLAQRPSFDSTIGETTTATAIPTKITPNSHHENIETRQSYQDKRLINDSSNLFPEENQIKPVKAATYTAESSNLFPEENQIKPVKATTYTAESSNLFQEEYQIKPVKAATYTAESSFNPRSSNSQQATANFKPTVNKIPQTLVETKPVANKAITDFRSVLKQRQTAPITQSANSNVMDFRTTTPQIITNNLKGITSATETFIERKPSSVYQTNLSVKPSNNGKPFVGFIPATDHATPSPSSPLYSSASEKRDQMPDDYMHTKNEEVTTNLKQTSIQQNINYSRGADVFSTYPDEPSSIVRQNWRTGNSQFSDNSLSSQDFNTPSGRLGATNLTKQTEAVNVLVKCNNAICFNDVSDISGVDDGTEDSVMRREYSVSVNKTDNTSLNKGIEAFGKGPNDGRRGKRASIDPLQVTSINQQSVFNSQSVPGSNPVQQDHVLPESEKLEVKITPSKVDLSKLSACKVNFCEFNPSEPQSEATTLEVTSVSASVPLRQSLSSPQFYPRPYSITDSDQKTTQYSDIKFEDDNDVFTDPSTESAPTYYESKFSSKPENNKQNLRLFGAREKSPGNETETKKGILSKKSSDPVNVNQRKDKTDNQTERINNTRLSEKYPDYKEQEKVESTTRFSTFSRSETSSSSGNLAQASHLSAKSTENLVDDFRKVKLKSAPGVNKDKFDLAKSKFMSKSTESIFIDVKLKPVSKPSDNYKKSEISSNADRIRASSKSMNFLKISSTSPFKNVSNYSPISKRDTTSAHTTPKFSECVKTFSSDAKPRIVPQNSRYQKSTQSSKIRTSYGKPLPGGVARASSNRKSKGVGAKFEEAITDSKTSKGQGHYTSLNTTRSRQVDVKTPTQAHLPGYNSGRTSDRFKVTESIPSQKCLEKDVNAAIKSNSDNATREGNSEGFQENVPDWIKKRQSVQTDNLPTLTSNRNTYSETGRSSVILSDSTKKLEGDKYTAETNNLAKTNRMSSPNSSRNEQQVKTDLSTRTFLNATEGRIRARTKRANLRDSNGSEWLPPDSGKMEVNQRIKNFEIRNTDVKHAYNNQKPDESLRDSPKLVPDTDSRKSSRTSAQVIKTNLGTLSDQSDLEGKDKLNSRDDSAPGLTSTSLNSASYSFREPEIFTTAITMTPKFQAERPTSSIIITKAMIGPTTPAVPSSSSSEIGNNKTISSLVNESKESFTTPTTSAPTDAKLHLVSTRRSRPEVAEQRHLEMLEAEDGSYTSAVVSSYLKHDSQFAPAEQFICVEPPSDQESLESQTGNDLPHFNNTSASWVKPRSQRQPNIYPLDETELTPYKESLKLLTDDSESVLSMASISSSSSDTSNTTVDSGYTRNYFRRRAANNVVNHIVSESLHPDNTASWNGISYPKDISNQGNGLNKNTEKNIRSSSNLQSIIRKHGEDPTVAFDDKPTRETREQQQIQLRDSSKAHTLKSTSFPQNSESIANVKEIELPSVSNDDSSGLIYMSRRQRRLLEKTNPPITDSDVKPEDGVNIQNNLSKYYLSELEASNTSIKSYSAISRMSTELDGPKSNFDLVNIKPAKDYYTSHTGTLENNMGHNLILSHTNDQPNQNQRFSYDKELKSERKPNVHHRINSMDRTDVSSTASQQNETRLSKSQIELTPQPRPAISSTPSSAVSLMQLNEQETENDLQHFPPSFPLPLHDVSVTFGTKAVLRCQVTGNPRPEVKWLLNLKQLEPSQAIEITMSEETSQLTITQMTREYEGDYTCWARNLLGTVSSHCTLSLDNYTPQLVTDSHKPYGITEAESKPAVGNMSASSAVLELASSDISAYDEFLFNPRDVTINTADKFQDLYEVDKEVGKGKFGVVYKCKLKSDNTVWAAKVIKCREAAKIELRREIEIMNKLRHPKLLQLWDAFEAPRQIVMVMEYISAGELFERVIADDFYLTENDCIHFMRQICEGVSYMHSNGVIHLDLKPENILCVSENSNRIKIIDFGLARLHTPGQSTRVLFGTPEFIAPEVINYDEISFETDVWSLGVICYVLLSGLSPFLGDNESETLANVTKGEYDFDDEAFEEISDLAKDFIGQLLIKRKEKRLLAGQCLSHPWLNQDEVDGSPAKRLNTDKLKRFMVRQKWLKTGNAVKAVSRLLKSNSLTGFGPFDRSAGSESGPDTPFNNRTLSSLQSTAEIAGDEEDDDEDEPNTVFDHMTPASSKVLEHVHQNSSEGSSSSKEENALSATNQNNFSKMNVASTWTSTARYPTAPISSDKNNERLISEKNSEENMKLISKEHETKNTITSRSSRNVSRETGINQNAEKSPDLTPSLAPKEIKSTHVSNTQRETTHLSKRGSEDTLLQGPRFTKSMTRCKTCAGDVARFAVVVTGTPPLHVTWFLEEDEIKADTRHTLISNENTGSFSLTIRNVKEDDEGEYTCKAVNSQGECTCSAELAVLLL